MNQKLPQKPPPAKTIDEVIAQLDEIISHSYSSNDYLFVFADVYRKTTQKIKEAIEADRFEDGKRMEKMDVIFGNLYISCYYNFLLNKNISKSWAFAFRLRNEPLALIQHILLSMNAHINFDLAVAAAEVAPGKTIIDLKNDFMTINEILAELTNKMQKDLGKVSIMIKVLDILGFRSDEKIINFSIKKARDFAWINALELALIEGETRQISINNIDNRVLELSKMIRQPPGKFLSIVLTFISMFETRDLEKIKRKLGIDPENT